MVVPFKRRDTQCNFNGGATIILSCVNLNIDQRRAKNYDEWINKYINSPFI
ncbi:hypothetical protein Aazo_2635 ['Nostoc azollae' 0708]|jgi:hypothetical protein|uniref:Uncharacterized protein n=1 Tax=Nostoc azollae (strain 0708) TaxID=551115 RepID=D7DZN9_NOSA0|nr:hypothetical protein Aazo_2635 ['Nostoc azollae' 0708]